MFSVEALRARITWSYINCKREFIYFKNKISKVLQTGERSTNKVTESETSIQPVKSFSHGLFPHGLMSYIKGNDSITVVE